LGACLGVRPRKQQISFKYFVSLSFPRPLISVDKRAPGNSQGSKLTEFGFVAIQIPNPAATINVIYPTICKTPCTHSKPGKLSTRIIMPPSGKINPNAKQASTACTSRIVLLFIDGPPEILTAPLFDDPELELLQSVPDTCLRTISCAVTSRI